MRSGVNFAFKKHTNDEQTSLRNACTKAVKLQDKINKIKNTAKQEYSILNDDLDSLKYKVSLILLDNANSFNLYSLICIGRSKLKGNIDDLDTFCFTYECTRLYQKLNVSVKPIVGKVNRFYVSVIYSNKELGCYGSNTFTIEEDEFNDFINIVKFSEGNYEARIGRNKVRIKSKYFEVSEVKTYFNNVAVENIF